MKDPTKRIEELEAQLRQTSSNSSKPPCTDLSRRQVLKAATGRKLGGSQDTRGQRERGST